MKSATIVSRLHNVKAWGWLARANATGSSVVCKSQQKATIIRVRPQRWIVGSYMRYGELLWDGDMRLKVKGHKGHYIYLKIHLTCNNLETSGVYCSDLRCSCLHFGIHFLVYFWHACTLGPGLYSPNIFGDAALINYANLCKFSQNHIKCYFLISRQILFKFGIQIYYR